MPSPVRWQQTGGGAKEDEAVPVVALRMPPQGRHASGIHRLVMRPRDIGIRGRVAWRLASTSLWRTAAPCFSWRRPTMPTFCSRVRKRRRKPCRQGLRLRPLGKRERSRESSDIAANPVFCNGLLDFGLGAGVLELLLRSFSVGLGNGFLDRLRRAVDQVLGFLEPKAGDLAYRLDHVDLVFV